MEKCYADNRLESPLYLQWDLTATEWFRFLSTGVVGTVVTVAGLFLNTGLMLASVRRVRWTKATYSVIALALWDNALLVTSWLMLSLSLLVFRGAFPLIGFWSVLNSVLYVIINITMAGCIYTTLAVSVERYLAVCHPLRHKRIYSKRRAVYVLIGVSVIAVVLNIPRYFETVIGYCNSTTGEGPVPMLRQSPVHSSQTYFVIYRIIGGLIFVSAGPFLGMSFMTVDIMYALRQAVISRRTMTVRPSPEPVSRPVAKRSSTRKLILTSIRSGEKDKPNGRRTNDWTRNKMLVFVLIKFLFCYTLPTLNDIFDCIFRQDFTQEIFYYLVDLSNLLVMIHSATNVLIYLTCAPLLRQWFCCRYRRFRKQSETNMSLNSISQASPGPQTRREIHGSRSHLEAMHNLSFAGSSKELTNV